jgi:hypothetical protein
VTPEQITEGIYGWLMAASRLNGLPMGTRPCTWTELAARDPTLAGQWRTGVGLLLDAIGAVPDDDDHLNFTCLPLAPVEVAADNEVGEEPPPVRPDD